MRTVFAKRSRQNLLLLLIFVFFLCARSPQILLKGRFWAEEGSFFFHNAWTQPFLSALFTSYGGYLNIAANTATLVAYWLVPLPQAPYVTIAMGLMFQMVPLFLLLTARDAWLSSFKTRVLATMLLLWVPETSEIALQSLHIQFTLALASAIILTLDTEKNYQRWFRLCILFLTPLCGVAVIPLVLLFGLRVLSHKEWLRFEQMCVFVFSSTLQILFFYQPNVNFARSYHFSLNDCLTIFFTRMIVIPFGGLNYRVIRYINHVSAMRLAHHTSLLACSCSVFALAILVFWSVRYYQCRVALWSLGSALLMLAISVYGAIGGGILMIDPYNSGRYLYGSQSLFCIVLLILSVNLPSKSRLIVNGIVGWLLLVGVYNYRHPHPLTMDGPSWRHEISLWKSNSQYKPKLWPEVNGGYWRVALPKN